MDVLEFVEEYKRMCAEYSYASCTDKCPAYRNCSLRNIDTLIPIVQKWAKEHPRVKNVDHVAEMLEKAGYRVDKEHIVQHMCPPNITSLFRQVCPPCPRDFKCDECRKWWNQEYKGE